MSKVLVTGGCGFIGSHVVDCLMKKGHDVYIVDNLSLGKDRWQNEGKKPTLFVESILDFNAFEKIVADIKPDVIIHLAAHHYIPFCEKNIREAYELNVMGTINALELSRVHGIKKFFIASTGDVYPPGFSPHREVDMTGPVYVYGHTKLIAEKACINYYEKMPAMSMVIGRLFNAAGPRETNPHFLPEVARQIAEGKKLVEVGNLWPKRDFIDVKSMAGVIADLTINAEGIDIINIGSGQVQDVGAALETLVSVLPFKVDIVSVAARQRPNDRPYLCPDVVKLNKILGRVANPLDQNTAKDIFKENGLY